MRITRAASRAQNQDDVHLIHEDGDAGEILESKLDLDSERPALKDITTENYPLLEDTPVEQVKSIDRKPSVKGRSRTVRKTKDAPEELTSGKELDVIELQKAAEQSHYSRDIGGGISKAEMGNEKELQLFVKQSVEEGHETPCKQPIAISKTPKFDPEKHVSPKDIIDQTQPIDEDSFIQSINVKTTGLPIETQGIQSTECITDSIVLQSPSVHSPRIEDSVEAIDALEEALEQMAEDLPTIERLTMSTPKLEATEPKQKTATRQTPLKSIAATGATQSKPVTNSVRKNVSVQGSVGKAAGPAAKSKPNMASAKTQPSAAAKPSVSSNKIIHSKKPVLATKSGMSFSNSPIKAKAETRTRVSSAALSTSKPAFMPVKSSKPPTTSTFTLPGEAISAKLKAQREERLKREEEAEKARKSFKARPAPSVSRRPSMAPRENKASQARLSMAAGSSDKENQSPKPNTVHRPSTGLQKIGTLRMNTGVRRTTGVKLSPPAPRISNVSTVTKLSGTKYDLPRQKVPIKEVMARPRDEIDRIEKAKKDKEDVAKRARAEAAERGRQASREWAERQKKRLALQGGKAQA